MPLPHWAATATTAELLLPFSFDDPFLPWLVHETTLHIWNHRVRRDVRAVKICFGIIHIIVISIIIIIVTTVKETMTTTTTICHWGSVWILLPPSS
jgi:hypothetical protein